MSQETKVKKLTEAELVTLIDNISQKIVNEKLEVEKAKWLAEEKPKWLAENVSTSKKELSERIEKLQKTVNEFLKG